MFLPGYAGFGVSGPYDCMIVQRIIEFRPKFPRIRFC
jgi:hypothetical protein